MPAIELTESLRFTVFAAKQLYDAHSRDAPAVRVDRGCRVRTSR
jgi:hypothetical protein